MQTQRTLRRVATAALLLVAFLFQGTWALAGTTGGIAGYVRDSSGAPVAQATVTASSPSQVATTKTDAQGHFLFLSLDPDTYTLSVTKEGLQPTSSAGAVVFADQTQQYDLRVSTLKTIANVKSAPASNLVKSGVAGDLYSVNATQAAAAAPLGGGGNLNNNYSALASVPGVQTGVGGLGWDYNAAYIRGQNSFYTGYEYDGIPVNRAFDNYNSSTESSLGLQELQVYTGGGPASIASSGTSGFINQVIKTGTYPGFASLTGGIGTPTFYHQAQVEAGGSTPDRNFSYYVGLSGYNQDYRFIDNSNGASFMEPGGIYSGDTLGYGIGYGASTTVTDQGVKPICPLVGQTGTIPAQGCWEYYNGLYGSPSQVTDREDVINLHFGIPRKDGLRDDIQALWSASALNNYAYSSPNDAGPGVNQFIYALTAGGATYAPPTCGPETVGPGLTVNGCSPSKGGYYLGYADGVSYNLPFGTVISSSKGNVKAPTVYYAPDTPAHQFDGPIPLDDEGINVNENDTGIAKLQYTHALSSSAYIRAYGYSFYSDWLQTGPFAGATGQDLYPGIAADPQYQLITHTIGGQLQFSDQINDQNLVNLTGNYTTAGVERINNSAAFGTSSPIGYYSTSGGKYTCYNATTGAAVPCLNGSYYNVATGTNLTSTWTSNAANGPTGYAAPAASGAAWHTLWNSNQNGSLNTVTPKFSSLSLSDEFRPNDKILVDAAVRYDNFTYGLPDSAGVNTQFYASQTANYTCVQASTNEVLTAPLPPGVPPPASAIYVNGDCDAAVAKLFPTAPQTGWVHPNGTTQDGVKAPDFTASSPGSYSLNYWQPRFSATYTQSPDTVWRVSAGRFVEPPISASVQYLSASGDDRSVWNNTLNLGFYSPFHPIPGLSSSQYDLSLERHLKGTDMSFKLTPFYTRISNWQQQTFIGANFVTQVPVGTGRNYGLEFAFDKGDFNRDGFSGEFNFTYTNAAVQFANVSIGSGTVTNEVTALNQVIAQYNQLAKGSPCYTPANPNTGAPGVGVSKCGPGDILNPYYGHPAGYLDPNGWYQPFSTAVAPNLNGSVGSYNSPVVSTLILNYRAHKLAITPSIQFLAGTYYGSPLDVTGVDPRSCAENSAVSGITKLSPNTNPYQCNYLTAIAPGFGQYSYLYVPNPQTGSFSALGSYENPSIITANLQLTYDVSSKIKLTLTGSNLFHTCFGGTPEPWTSANPPGTNTCGYSAAGGPLNSTTYPSNFYNGTSINDVAANKATTPFTQSYNPSYTGLFPFNLYVTAQVRL